MFTTILETKVLLVLLLNNPPETEALQSKLRVYKSHHQFYVNSTKIPNRISYNSIQCSVHSHIKNIHRICWIHADLGLVLHSSTCTQFKSIDLAREPLDQRTDQALKQKNLTLSVNQRPPTLTKEQHKLPGYKLQLFH